MSIALVIGLVLALLVVPVSWLGWKVSRHMAAFDLYRSADAELSDTPLVTPKHLAALRKLRFAWSPLVESGGPSVDPRTPFGSANMADDLGPIIGTRDELALARFHLEVSSVLIWALKHGDLAEGQYRLAHLDNAAMERLLRREMAGLPHHLIEAGVSRLPRLDPDGQLHITEQHRRLLRELRMHWPNPSTMSYMDRGGYPVLAVYFKRPFGDMSAFELDMADILGLPTPDTDKVDPVLDRLYWELWPALQIFVEHATFDMERTSSASR
jgi:hypothetical protein